MGEKNIKNINTSIMHLIIKQNIKHMSMAELLWMNVVIHNIKHNIIELYKCCNAHCSTNGRQVCMG